MGGCGEPITGEATGGPNRGWRGRQDNGIGRARVDDWGASGRGADYGYRSSYTVGWLPWRRHRLMTQKVATMLMLGEFSFAWCFPFT